MSDGHKRKLSKLDYINVETGLRTIAEIIRHLPLTEFIHDCEIMDGPLGSSRQRVLYSPLMDKLLHPHKLAVALLPAQEVANRNLRCVCGHGYDMHRTPGSECIYKIVENCQQCKPEDPCFHTYCQCSTFVLDAMEY